MFYLTKSQRCKANFGRHGRYITSRKAPCFPPLLFFLSSHRPMIITSAGKPKWVTGQFPKRPRTQRKINRTEQTSKLRPSRVSEQSNNALEGSWSVFVVASSFSSSASHTVLLWCGCAGTKACGEAFFGLLIFITWVRVMRFIISGKISWRND